jgi:trk system potassium uptake protein TrkA
MADVNVYAVIGLGSFGRRVCEVLSDRGMSVIAMDNDPELVDKISDRVTHAVCLDTTDPDQITQTGLSDVDVGVVAIGENIEASILTTALLKRMGVSYIFARAVNDIHYQVLQQIGAHEVVNIEIDSGERIAQQLVAPDMLDQIPISEDISIAEVYPPEGFAGKSLSTLDLRNKFRITVVSIKRVHLSVDESGKTVRSEDIIFPTADTKVAKNDTLIVVGENDDLSQFRDYSPKGG